MVNEGLTDIILKRKSVRKYEDTDVPDEMISKIINLASEAPSAGGLKAYEVIVTRERLFDKIIAPVYLVVCAAPGKSGIKYGDRGRNLYALQDATIFASYIQLIAVDMGLSNVWVGAFKENKIKKLLDIKDELKPIAIIAMGYGK